ncbi:MAG: glycosyltransferase family 2 protein [Nitrospiraceae bacterium]|nr:MAG: glycosyltransferase family 2 protein [Nitrospiraceae bacterium]
MASHTLPLVSIAVPLFRSRRFVADIIANLDAIEYPNVEIILSDRHGEDDAVDVLAEHFKDDSRVRVLVAHDRLNWVEHYNLLMQSSSGKYFMWMTHDDLYPGAYVSQLALALEGHPEVVLAYGRLKTVSLDGSPVPVAIESVPPVGARDLWSAQVALRLLFFWNIWVTFRGLMRRETVMQSSLFIRPTLDLVEADVYWAFAIALKGRFRFVPECSCTKRFHSMSASAFWQHGRLRYLLNGANVLRAYIAQVLSNRWAILYATTMVCCWTLLRIVGSWTRNCAWIVRRRGRLQRIAEKVLFPKDCNTCHR